MNLSPAKNLRHSNPQLYPPRTNANFYIFTALRNQIEQILSVYLSPRVGATVVDFGCGDMPYRALIEPCATHYISADLPDNPQATVYINPDGGLPIESASVDMVISTQVLEHLAHPENYLLESFRVLKSNGLLILSTHGYWPYHPHPTDYWRWTGSGLSKIVQEAGFCVVERRGIMGLASLAVQILQDALLRKTPPVLKPVIALIMQSFIILLDGFYTPDSRRDDACVFIVVAVKP